MGKIGGPARAKALTPERRKEIAQLAAAARWLGKRQNGTPAAPSDPGTSAKKDQPTKKERTEAQIDYVLQALSDHRQGSKKGKKKKAQNA